MAETVGVLELPSSVSADESESIIITNEQGYSSRVSLAIAVGSTRSQSSLGLSNLGKTINLSASDVSGHIADASKHITAHGNLSGIGTNSHSQIDTHIADNSKHITAHGSLSGIGTNSHSQIDTHIADNSKHITAHGSLSGIGTNSHSQIDTHIADNSKHLSGTTQTWETLTLLNGWANMGGGFRSAAYTKTDTGEIVLKGRLSSSAATSRIICTMPSGYRPANTISLVAWGDGVAMLITVYNSGNVEIGSIQNISLEQVRFYI